VEIHGSSGEPLLLVAVEYDASDNAVYVGESAPGTSQSSIGWRIKTITYDASDNATDVKWANGDHNFKNVFDDRAGYSYS